MTEYHGSNHRLKASILSKDFAMASSSFLTSLKNSFGEFRGRFDSAPLDHNATEDSASVTVIPKTRSPSFSSPFFPDLSPTPPDRSESTQPPLFSTPAQVLSYAGTSPLFSSSSTQQPSPILLTTTPASPPLPSAELACRPKQRQQQQQQQDDPFLSIVQQIEELRSEIAALRLQHEEDQQLIARLQQNQPQHDPLTQQPPPTETDGLIPYLSKSKKKKMKKIERERIFAENRWML